MFEDYQQYSNPTLAGVLLPSVKIDQRHYDALEIPNTTSNYDFLRKLCWKGIQEKGIGKLPNVNEYYERVKRELETFNELGFVEYVLLNWEVHVFCIENGIPKGFARGSAASSLVLYLIRVTDIDPIKAGLFFERFVSKSRAKKILGDDGVTYLDGSLLADVDSDISYDRRHEVIKYIEEKHKGRTSKILTLGTLSSKLILRECGKIVDGLNEDEVGYISDNVPKEFNIPVSIKDGLEQSDKLKALAAKYPKTFAIAKKLEGLIKNTGVHASGIAIGYDQIDNLMPIQMTKEGEIVSGYEMNDVASLAVKFDILGLKTLTVVDDCCKQLGINMSDIDENDQSIYDALKNLYAPQGIFQVETDATFRVCQQVRPSNIEQLTAVISISRPGTISFVGDYAKFVQTGESQVAHPFLEECFANGGGCPIYQESTLKALNKIGFDLESCETARKVIAKKLTDKMPEWEQKVKDKIKENNLDPKIGDVLWKVMSDSANYQFALCHGRSYSRLTAITLWLKFNHPKEFFLSLLKMSKFEQEPFEQISRIVQELPLFNLKLLNPDLAKSSEDFSIESNGIRYGMNSIRGVSEKTLSALLSFRDKEFQNKYEIFLAAKDVGLSIGILQTLIQAGCMDSFNTERCLLVLEARMFNELTEKEKIRVIEFGPRHNHNILAALKEIGEGKLLDEKGKPVISEKRLNTLREKYKTHRQIYDQNHKHKEFANWFFEKKLLGYSYSYTLRQVFQEPEHSFTPILRAKSFDDGQEIKIVGVVTDSIKKKSKKGNNYMSLELSDETGRIRAMLGDSPKEKKLEKWLENNKQPDEDQIVILVGKKNKDTIFIDKLTIMDEVIAFNKKDLKE